MRFLYFSLLVILIFISCKKEKLDGNAYWQCHHAQNFDSAAISNKLVGSWKWKKRYCSWTDKTEAANKNINLNLTAGGTYALRENSTVLKQGNWEIFKLNGNSWSIRLTPYTDYTNGEVLFCGDELLIYDSPLDGCDDLFKRTN